MSRESDGTLKFIVGLMAGAAVGGVLGLLFAPKKGSALREDIREFVSNLPEKVEEDIRNPEGKTRSLINRTKIGLENQVDKVSKNIQANKMAEAKKREEMASGLDYM
jgi:gas vesicle protein